MEFAADANGVAQGMEWLIEELKRYKLEGSELNRANLAAEESMLKLTEHTAEGASVRVEVYKRWGDVCVKISAVGSAFEFFGSSTPEINEDLEESAIRDIMLRVLKENVKYKNSHNRNTVLIIAKRSDKKMLYWTVAAFVGAIVFSLFAKAVLPETVTSGLITYLFKPGRTMFLNALKMIAAPVVFFSIITCISGLSNLSELKSVGTKIFSMYMLTTFVAILVGVGVFYLFTPGDPGLMSAVSAESSAKITATAAKTDVSILDTIVNIVPSSIVAPFLKADMIQIIFIALLLGVSVGFIGDYSKPLQELFEACRTLFLQATVAIIKLVPVVVFFAMSALLIQTGMDTLLSIMGYFIAVLLGMACMQVVYSGFMVLSRLNPLTFYKKYAPSMLMSFVLASSNASIPHNLKACREKLGISPKVCNISIPLGATLNMDGTCVMLAVGAMFFSRIYGLDLSGGDMIAMFFTIVVLSIGAPGVPGSGLICLSILVLQLGIPVEAVSLVMGIDPIIGMCRVASNTAGDVAVSTVVAKHEGMLDQDVFNG